MPLSQASLACPQCSYPVEHSAHFCGECGATTRASQSSPSSLQTPPSNRSRAATEESFTASFQRTQPVMFAHESHHQAVNLAPQAPTQTSTPTRTPNFARVVPKIQKPIPSELNEEIRKLIINLARERLFLVMHLTIFLGANALGVTLAIVAYNGYIADELTRCVMALTPMFFINTIALACLAPIKGTKREIQRLKERLTYMKFQVEYLNLF